MIKPTKNNFNPLPLEPLLIVISGPSGVGKDSVLEKMKTRGLPFHFVVTATTRVPRPEEVHGVDYFFLSNDEFADMINNDELLEYAIVYNDYKGIPKAQVRKALASGKDVVMRIDVQGAETIRGLAEDALLIFLTTETEDELVRRLERRSTETPEDLNLRIATARKELEKIENFDYVVPNKEDQLEKTVEIIEAIIKAEHHRVEQRKVNL
ncbi:MAG: guanylate kinase [Chloroflexota bacterium]|nr:MAG: guanylate kinase [Chloroflexota bacterium]